MTGAPPNRPIGYWLKRVDSLLTQRIDGAQAEHRLSRVDWQVLNVLREARPLPRHSLSTQLQPFLTAPELDAAVQSLVDRGWVAPSGEGLTPGGEQQHARVLATQTQLRQQAMQGVSEADYQMVLRVLERVASNLESGEADA